MMISAAVPRRRVGLLAMSAFRAAAFPTVPAARSLFAAAASAAAPALASHRRAPQAATTTRRRGFAFAPTRHEWDENGMLREVRRASKTQLRKKRVALMDKRKDRLRQWWRDQGFSQRGRVETMVRKGAGRFREPAQCAAHLRRIHALYGQPPFNIRPNQVTNMVQACPNLFFVPPEWLQANLARVAAHPELAATDLHLLVRKNPRMLAVEPAVLGDALGSLR